MKPFILFASLILFSVTLMGKTKIVSLHPIISDVAKQIGGDHVEIVNLLGESTNVHSFSPTPSSLKKATGAKLYLASGKGLESYLPKLKQMVGEANVIEVGMGVKSIVVKDDHFQ